MRCLLVLVLDIELIFIEENCLKIHLIIPQKIWTTINVKDFFSSRLPLKQKAPNRTTFRSKIFLY